MKKLQDEQWVVTRFDGVVTVSEERVRDEGGEVWKAYREAQTKGIFFRAIMDSIMGDKETPMMPRIPRITEKFIDSVVERAGGRRLTPEECNHDLTQNADYLLEDRVLELKILEEEGLDKGSRQAKLANLFDRPASLYSIIELDPATLPEEMRRRYADIVGGPIQNAIKSASEQIRSTKEHLKRDQSRGGVIIVNTGYGTLHRDMLYPLAQRYAAKDTTQVKDVIAISTWLVPGKAFDGTIYFRFEPKAPADPTLAKLERAFWDRVMEFMTDFMRSGMTLGGDPIDPLRPITFEQNGIVFASIPTEGDSLNQEDSEETSPNGE